MSKQDKNSQLGLIVRMRDHLVHVLGLNISESMLVNQIHLRERGISKKGFLTAFQLEVCSMKTFVANAKFGYEDLEAKCYLYFLQSGDYHESAFPVEALYDSDSDESEEDIAQNLIPDLEPHNVVNFRAPALYVSESEESVDNIPDLEEMNTGPTLYHTSSDSEISDDDIPAPEEINPARLNFYAPAHYISESGESDDNDSDLEDDYEMAYEHIHNRVSELTAMLLLHELRH